MKHNTPQLQYSPCADLAALFSQAAEEETDVEFVLFENLTLTEGDFPGLTFRNCRFTGCRISGIALERAAFIDCVLEHCDCSNVNLQKASLERTRLSDCKLVGATLSEAFLLDVSLIDCIARLATSAPRKYGTHALPTATCRTRRLAAASWQRPHSNVACSFGRSCSNTVCRHGSSDCDISGIAISGGSCEMRA